LSSCRCRDVDDRSPLQTIQLPHIDWMIPKLRSPKKVTLV
jgi:hypothetical protein